MLIMKQLRDWQKDAKESLREIISKTDKSTDEELVAVNACVGSGKTNVAFEAFIDYLDIHKPEKSIQMFVCPRINLCKQQAADFKRDYEEERAKYNITVSEWHCESPDFKDRDIDTIWASANAKHYVIFIVDESIWGTEEVQTKNNIKFNKSRFDDFNKKLDKAAELGFQFGVIAYDEAHNYQSNQEEMFGENKYLEED